MHRARACPRGETSAPTLSSASEMASSILEVTVVLLTLTEKAYFDHSYCTNNSTHQTHKANKGSRATKSNARQRTQGNQHLDIQEATPTNRKPTTESPRDSSPRTIVQLYLEVVTIIVSHGFILGFSNDKSKQSVKIRITTLVSARGERKSVPLTGTRDWGMLPNHRTRRADGLRAVRAVRAPCPRSC